MKAFIYKHRLLALSLGAVVLIIVLASAASVQHAHTTTAAKQAVTSLNGGQTYDPASHETLSNPTGKAPDTYGQTSNEPLFLGLSSLLNYGISSDSITNLETAFEDYNTSIKSTVKDVSVVINTIAMGQQDPASTNSELDFNVLLNLKTTYVAHVVYSDLNFQVELYLYQPTTMALIYDSGIVTDSGGE